MLQKYDGNGMAHTRYSVSKNEESKKMILKNTCRCFVLDFDEIQSI